MTESALQYTLEFKASYYGSVQKHAQGFLKHITYIPR